MLNNYKSMCSKRVKFLKDQLLTKEREVCSERAILITEAYKKYSAYPPILKRAKALEEILTGMTVFILDEELIVGHQSSKQKSAPVYPEMDVNWLKEEIDLLETRNEDSFKVSPEVREDLLSIIPYWEDKSIRKAIFSALPSETKRLREEAKVFSITAHEETALGHVLLDYEKVLKRGFEGIKKDVQAKIDNLAVYEPGDIDKHNFYRASLIVCDAAIKFAKRYADQARRIAKNETNPGRKRELNQIASICDRVPAKPARNFWEALQSLWFVQLIPQIENNGSSYSPGRFDQYMFPFYSKDLEQGELSPEEAQELLDCFWLKFSEPLILYNAEAARIAGGFPMGQNLTIGGKNRRGEDCTNELSFLCLNAQEHVGLAQPNFTVRVHRKSPLEFLMRTAEVIKQGTGMPQVMNDEVCIPAMINNGLSIQEARDYAPVGCVENNIVGGWGRENGGYLNLAKVLEYTLNNGICRLTGKQNGLALGYLSDYKSFDELLASFKEQLHYFIPHLIVENNIIDKIHAEIVPSPIVSVLVPGCLESGQEVTAGGAKYNFSGPTAVGGANTGNALAAIKKLVFEEKAIEPEKLEKALAANFAGYEDIKRTLEEKAPKYGNDKDYVDSILKEIIDTYADEIEKYTNYRGGPFRPGLTAVTAHVGMGMDVGATPDGRLAGAALAGGISPVAGTEKKGPTAATRSVSKLDFRRYGKAMILNQTISPSVLESKKGLRKFVDLIRTYFDLGGMHIQFNIISADILKDAQKNPGDYQNLVVRVAGYSALFVGLSPEVQNQIIARTEHKTI